MVAYSEYKSLEPRTVQFLSDILEQPPYRGRVDNHMYILISADDSVADWLTKNHDPKDRTVVGISKADLIKSRSDAWYVKTQIERRFFERDLFNYTLPLSSDIGFYGRNRIVNEAFDAIRRGENRGIFGLRKTGKTSILYKLKRKLESEGTGLCLYFDCKEPYIRRSRWNELIQDICLKIKKEFNIQMNLDFSERNSSRSMSRLFEFLSKRGKSVCLMFDEVEYISYNANLDKHWEYDFIDFWQTVWSTQSQYRNLSFIVAGVNASSVEKSLINKIQNPLFGIVSHEYIGSLAEKDVKRMVSEIGRKMGITFENDSLEAIYEIYGGHPLLTRIACSSLNSLIKESSRKPFNVTREYILSNSKVFDLDLTYYCESVISELKEFYAEEFDMFRLLCSDQKIDFMELAGSADINHLLDYGLIRRDGIDYKVVTKVIKDYVASGYAREEKRQTQFRPVGNKDRTHWLGRRQVLIVSEFKNLERLILKTGKDTLFGVNSFPEADEFASIKLVEDKRSFDSFINTMHRCFVESIERYGRSIGRNKYYWDEIKSSYPDLHQALQRIRTYRNNSDHLELIEPVDEGLRKLLRSDLEGKNVNSVKDGYFILQQRTMDELLHSILLESNKLS